MSVHSHVLNIVTKTANEQADVTRFLTADAALDPRCTATDIARGKVGGNLNASCPSVAVDKAALRMHKREMNLRGPWMLKRHALWI
jgi:hypothetical protein